MRLVFATHNKNKLEEIKNMLPNYIELLSLTEIGCHEDIAETADTIDGNAILKAKYVTEKYGYNCFADDTGLEVESLNGAPGVYSARYAGEEKNNDANIEKLLKNLKDKHNRSARFKTVIALSLNDHESLFTGICTGEITEEKRGEKGFGYDSIFLPEGKNKTFAEMNSEEKNEISHRARAFKQLVSYLSE
ncbi:non-canonical purine NTP diphosphatase [Mesonia sp. K4-1]|uniref:non-canonical purine NTP diphosphatase n=1 Tax=Mesonia sp. K4-1 TaxID=2602760 RepID=UPI0011C71A17|nr:non-canonical purine NTP diphosphatase [Mesonia sp. K4-1]TXK74908.1 non-canonical purine NTP diphosphatase [Mesonia sp. K4-1]